MRLLPLLAASACVPIQSALHPRGPAAEHIAALWWAMLAVAGLVSLLVTVLLLLALRRRHRDRARERDAAGMPPVIDEPDEAHGMRWILLGGVALPAVVLTALFLGTAASLRALSTPDETPLEVDITARQWWWEVRYHHASSNTRFRTANELHIPVGVPVRITLRAHDVIHSFWVPQLGGKMDAVPGHENVTWLQADVPGVYRGQCAEYCGLQHAHMALEVVAHEPAAWAQWLVRERAPAAPPPDSLAAAGLQSFQTRGCALCHGIRGTAAHASAGPDLTHFGRRRTIGAGTRPNVRGQLAGWIADPHGIKPGVHMPPMTLPPGELHSIVHYLEGLR